MPVIQPLRELLPAQASPTSAPTAPSLDGSEASQPSTSTVRRRPQTRIACGQCRRKKSKCDGLRPVCTTCANSGHGDDCEYDGDPDLTRAAAMRRKLDELNRRAQLLEDLFEVLSSRSDHEAVDIIHRMRATRANGDIEGLISFIRDGDLLVQLAAAGTDGEAVVRAHEPASNPEAVPPEEMTTWLTALRLRASSLETPARVAFLDAIKTQVNDLLGEDTDSGLSASQRPSDPSSTKGSATSTTPPIPRPDETT